MGVNRRRRRLQASGIKGYAGYRQALVLALPLSTSYNISCLVPPQRTECRA